MTFSLPFEPFPPEEPGGRGKHPFLQRVYESAVTAADAYHVVRQAVRVDKGVLRIGNRFLRVDTFREIGFVAVGNAAGSMAHAFCHSLGDRVGRGFVAGPDPPPPEVPFRSEAVPLPGFATPASDRVAEAALEIADGMDEGDLLVVLLSPGGLGLLAQPPQSWGRPFFSEWIERCRAAGATGSELGLVLRLLARGPVGGGLARSVPKAQVETLIIDRGDGPAQLAGGPTIVPRPEERLRGRSLLDRWTMRSTLQGVEGGAFEPDTTSARSAGANVRRPVVIAQPADAVRGAADMISERKWVPRLVALRLPDPADAAAREFLDHVEKASLQASRVPATGDSRGLVLLAGTTLDTLEGVDERSGFGRFLHDSAAHIRRRGIIVGILRTAGGAGPATEAPGQCVFATGSASSASPFSQGGLMMHPGITDVGCLAVAIVPFAGTS
ncbi:MAG: DUF4147 domain-containing protein [Thermoplasmata archaeon]